MSAILLHRPPKPASLTSSDEIVDSGDMEDDPSARLGAKDWGGSTEAPWTWEVDVDVIDGCIDASSSSCEHVVCNFTRKRTTFSRNDELISVSSTAGTFRLPRRDGSFPSSDNAPMPQYVHPAANSI